MTSIRPRFIGQIVILKDILAAPALAHPLEKDLYQIRLISLGGQRVPSRAPENGKSRSKKKKKKKKNKKGETPVYARPVQANPKFHQLSSVTTRNKDKLPLPTLLENGLSWAHPPPMGLQGEVQMAEWAKSQRALENKDRRSHPLLSEE